MNVMLVVAENNTRNLRAFMDRPAVSSQQDDPVEATVSELEQLRSPVADRAVKVPAGVI
jgi:hypothetical protein